VLPFKPWHIDYLSIQNGQRGDGWLYEMSTQQWQDMADNHTTFTGLKDDNILIICGLVPVWNGRATCWTVLSNDVDRYALLWIHKNVSKFLDTLQTDRKFNRIEADVRNDYQQGHRWMRLLGFEKESVMAQYDPNGSECARYVRLSNGSVFA